MLKDAGKTGFKEMNIKPSDKKRHIEAYQEALKELPHILKVVIIIQNKWHPSFISYTKFILRGWPQRQQETLYPIQGGFSTGDYI